MKTIVKTTMAMMAAAALMTGCNNILTGEKPESVLHKGINCDDSAALDVLKSIVDQKFNGDFEIEKSNIVVWDYNPVGRYTCKAKIKRVGDNTKKKPTSKSSELDALMMMSTMFAPAAYGISNEGGWVNYYTYTTTMSNRKNRHLYVEIFSDDKQ